LHLVGILFPHINEDARSKSHQSLNLMFICCFVDKFDWLGNTAISLKFWNFLSLLFSLSQ